MIFKWEDGRTQYIRPGGNCNGLIHNQSRPVILELDNNDLDRLVMSPPSYLLHLAKSLGPLKESTNESRR